MFDEAEACEVSAVFVQITTSKHATVYTFSAAQRSVLQTHTNEYSDLYRHDAVGFLGMCAQLNREGRKYFTPV